ncbi:family 16 glycosylhydrolase [Colwelliaceae bacterium BS250]
MSFSLTDRRFFLPVTVLVALITLYGCVPDAGSDKTSQYELDVDSSADHQTNELEKFAWQLIWQDEFDTSTIDRSKWNAEIDCWGGGNDELQCYTDRADNGFTQDGMLHMVAKEEDYSGPKFSDIHPEYNSNDKSKTSPFTSVRLQTKNKLSIRYGRVDIRAKVAPGQGMWSAFWMLPSDNVYGKWPASGEIDIMESLNPGIAANEVHGTLHYGLPWPQWENKVEAFHMDASPSDNFHVYSIEWQADEIRWYVDSKHYQTQSATGWYNYIWQGQEQGFQVANPAAPFDQEFYLIMNIAVGGNWPGEPDRNWPEDRKMLVDYVRVYQCQDGQQGSPQPDGKGCATIDANVTLNTDLGKPASNQYSLYTDGPETLSFAVQGGKVTNTLYTAVAGSADDKVVQQDIELSDPHGKVWDIKLKGSNSVALVSNASSSMPGYEKGLRFEGGTSWSQNGEVEFDLMVKNASSDSQLLLSMASDNDRKGSTAIDMPAPGKWQHVVVKVADILSSRAEEDGVDLSNVMSPFVLDYTGTNAHLQIDNIKLECAYNSEPESWQLDQSCGISPRKTPAKAIFETINDQDWTVWDCCSGAEFSQVDDKQLTSQVVEFRFANAPTAPGFIAPRPLDISDYAGGTLEFDFKQITPPPVGSTWSVKLEADISAAQALLTVGGPTPNNEWQHYVFALSSQMENADLSNVKRILVFPDWGKAEGAVMRIDNVRFVPAKD